jgi:glucose-1-phosphate thymidylyltransferase
MFDRHVFEAVDNVKPSARGEMEITDTIQYLLDHGYSVEAEVLDRPWIDTGKMADILAASKAVLETLPPRRDGSVDERSRVYDPVILEEGSRVVNSVLRGPLIIGRDTEVLDSFVGPFTSIDKGCRLKGVRIQDSIVMEGSRIEETHWIIDKSLIGRFVEVRGGGSVGGGYSLTLGDHSRIEMPEE